VRGQSYQYYYYSQRDGEKASRGAPPKDSPGAPARA
jgi:hypothetical protein